MIVVGITGGIASGKSTALKFIKNKKIPTHDSDEVVNLLYKKPPKDFLLYLKKNNFSDSIKNNKINKKIIKEKIIKKPPKLKKLEKFIHKIVAKERSLFLKNNKKKGKKIVVLDIPLLYEKKLDKICNKVIFIYCPIQKRKERALKRKNMTPKMLNNLLKLQLPDSFKKKKAHFIINGYGSKKESFNHLSKVLKSLKS